MSNETQHVEDFKHFLTNLKYFTEDDPDLKLKPHHFSGAAVNSFIDFNSSPRGVMLSSQVSQRIVINNPTVNSIQNSTNYELGKCTISKKLEDNVEVLSVIKRRVSFKSKILERVVVFRNLETGVIDCLEMPLFSRLHNYFGFEFDVDKRVDSLNRGDLLEKDTLLAKSPALTDDGLYNMGRDVNVALMSHRDVDEDGFLVSKQFLEDFKFNIFETYTLEGGEESFFLNVNEKNGEYTPFPRIGDKINSNGLIMASRNFDDQYAPSLYSPKACREANPIFDNCVYGRNFDGEVIDVKVFKSNKRKKTLPIGTGGTLDQHAASLVSYYKQLIDVYETLNSEHRNLHGYDLSVGNSFNVLLVEAYGIVESEVPSNKLKKMYRKEILDLYRVQVTVRYDVTLNKGFKPTDLSANKGTVVSIMENEDMPIDKDGNRADLIMDIKSTPSRLNGGRLYEHGIKGSLLKVKKFIVDECKAMNINIHNASKENIKQLFKTIIEFLDIIDNNQTKIYRDAYVTNNYTMMHSVLIEVVEKAFVIKLEPGHDEDELKYIIIEKIRASRFMPLKDKVSYVIDGKRVTSKEDIMIAPMYIILLSKIADDILTTSSAAVNHYGIPTVVSKNDKSKVPHRNSPVRTCGESEGRVFLAYGGRELVAEIKDMNTSLISHELVHKSILNAEQPTNIECLIDRKKHPYGGDRGLEILSTLNSSVGMEVVHHKDKNRFVDMDNVQTREINTITNMERIEED